jgi:hypothetical protein
LAPTSDAPRPDPAPSTEAPTRTPSRGAPPPAPPPPGPDGYEFSDAHKESFRALAASVSFVGVCTLLFAALTGIFATGEVYMGFVPNGAATAIAGGIYGLMAWWMVSAGRSLSAMVRTRGRDVEHLMDAVAHLRRLFGLWRIAIILLALLVVVAGSAIVWCTFVVERGGKCFGALGT